MNQTVANHIAALRELIEQLRPHIRPEADQIAGSLAVALDQAQAAAEAEPTPASSIDEQLAAMATELRQVHAEVRTLVEAVGV